MKPSNEVIELLVELGLMTKSDILGVHAAQGEAILQHLMKSGVVDREKSTDVREMLETLLTPTNPTSKADAQVRFYSLITEHFDARTAEAHQELDRHTKRITSRGVPALAIAEEG
jgi:hypothetical protein